jgi:hypothetical protein
MLTPSWKSLVMASAVPVPGTLSLYSAIITSLVPPPMSIEAIRTTPPSRP